MLLPFFEWMQELSVVAAMQQTAWAQPTTNVLHLLAVAVFAGAVAIVDVRLLGGGLTKQPLSQVAGDARPWLIGSFLALLLTGLPQLATLAIRNYYNFFFWYKMIALVLAVIFTLTVRQWVSDADEGSVSPVLAKLVGAISVVLWLSVIIPARFIGLS